MIPESTDVIPTSTCPIVATPETIAPSSINVVFIVATPTILVVPLTSKNSLGTDVPIPTRPLGFTIKLSSSTWTPLRKLNDFL